MRRILNICLLLTFLVGYLEWGEGQHLFIIQAEAEIFLKGREDIRSILHPFIFIPFIGQLLLLFSIFQHTVSRFLTLSGLACLAVLVLLLLVVGIVEFNVRIIGSTVPFIITSCFVLRYNWKRISAYN